jgi:hypothetical protein
MRSEGAHIVLDVFEDVLMVFKVLVAFMPDVVE